MGKRYLYIIVFIVVLFLARGKIFTVAGSLTPPSSNISPTAVPHPTPRPPLPDYFSIPKINVVAPIEPVTTDEKGTMQLPEGIDKVGWYSNGFRPGEKGNAVFAGHLDSTTGAGAIFYRLGELEPGDDLVIADKTGALYTYVVTQKESYEYDKVPIAEIFGPSNKKLLNLITCTGTWNAAAHNYSHRMVITGELKEN
jgi:sortase A